ncbi:hypothetical protein Tco_1132123 [Tanacetum coccineum]|uniref:Uncharacterized protein n=1 Tax=Tanacetum coccineum TaxID=301880 RepID=A0ABQ5JAZ8_9ASTR
MRPTSLLLNPSRPYMMELDSLYVIREPLNQISHCLIRHIHFTICHLASRLPSILHASCMVSYKDDLYKLLLVQVMAMPAVFVSAYSSKESFGDTIEIGVDVTHPMLVTLVVFPAATVVIRLAQHGEAIQGIQEHLLEMPTQDKLRALRDRAYIAKAERATLRAMIRTIGAVKTSLHNRMRDERHTRIEIERELALVQEELTQSRISHAQN